MTARTILAAILVALAPASAQQAPATAKAPLPVVTPAWADALPKDIREPLAQALQATGGFAFPGAEIFSATANDNAQCFLGQFKGVKVTAVEKPLSVADKAAGRQAQWDVEIHVETMRLATWKAPPGDINAPTLVPPDDAPKWQKWIPGGVIFRDVVYVDKDRFVWPEALKERMDKNNGNDASGNFPMRPSQALIQASQKRATAEE